MKKIIPLIIILIAAGAGFYFYNKHEAQAPINEPIQNLPQSGSDSSTPPATSTGANTQTPVKGSNGPDYTPGGYSDGGETTGSDIQVVEVDFDGKSFTPATITIHPNDYVFFKNSSTVNFWPASDPHPTHTDYPGFDAQKPIVPGQQYKFQFTKIGSWGYHDHLDHDITGTVVVVK